MEMMVSLMIRTLNYNRKRTILTICTIILSVGMITAVLCGGWSMLSFLRDKEAVYGGDYAYRMDLSSAYQADELMQEKNVDDVSLLGVVGSSFYGEPSNKTLLAIAGINDSFVENFSLQQYLLEGRFPESENEILLTEDFVRENARNISVGDTIHLSVGRRIWDEIDAELYGTVNYLGNRESFHPEEERDFTIVGIASDMNGSKVAGEFNAYTGMSRAASQMTAYVKCSKVSKSIFEEAGENAAAVSGEDVIFHSDLLLYYGISEGKGAVKTVLLLTAVICLLMAASAAMISNVLSISLQERMMQLGMLASVGATRKQKKATVTLEAFILGVIGVPLGLLVGLGLTAGVLAVIRLLYETTFTFGIVTLHMQIHWLVLLLSAGSGIGALYFAGKAPGRAAAKATVIDTLKQNNVYELKKKHVAGGKIMSLFFGIHGTLASKNIRRNPKRFRAITLSIFLAVVLGLSLYSFSDFMLYQTSMDMNPDGTSYIDVEASIACQDLPEAVAAVSDEGLPADISYRISRYMTASFAEDAINPEMSGYFRNGNLAELYVVGMDEEHFSAICEENGFDYSAYEGRTDSGILINHTTGEYGVSSNRIVTGSPFVLEGGEALQLNYGSDAQNTVIIRDVLRDDNTSLQSQFVRDRAVLIVPISFFTWLLNDDTYIDLAIRTSQHEAVANCLADRGFFQVVDVAQVTENSRQVYTLLKMMVCIFTVLMTFMIGPNACNTISNTINVRRSEFAVLRSIGMTSDGLRKMLLMEASLYAAKSLLFALPVSLMVRFGMYSLISRGMTPFVFYMDWGIYGVAVILVILIVVMAMLFSLQSVKKLEIVSELKRGSM